MTKYIKNKDGKFAGSIGEGKSRLPAGAVIPTEALLAAFDKSPNGAITFDQLAAAYQQSHNPTEESLDEVRERAASGLPHPHHSETFFGTSVAEPEAFDNAADWGDSLRETIETSDPQTFREDYLDGAFLMRNEQTDEYVFELYDYEADDIGATLRYSPSYNLAFVETYTHDDFATTEDLSSRYLAVIKDVVADRF